MHFMQIESVLQTKNRSEPAKNRFSVALPGGMWCPWAQGVCVCPRAETDPFLEH